MPEHGRSHMVHLILKFLLVSITLFLLGCGATKDNSRRDVPIGFVNHTQRHSDAYLHGQWAAAQKSIATEIWINPLDENPRYLPGDSRAYDVQPHQIEVDAVPDVSPDELFLETGNIRPNPTGLIPYPQTAFKYVPAYSTPGVNSEYAASWESSSNPADFPTIIQYEFENHILAALGYDLSRR